MFIADFHIHSKYSRATSKECVPERLDYWARLKGLNLIGTGDFTHPQWRQELKEKLIPAEEGLYTLKKEFRDGGYDSGEETAPRFIVSGEISSIYKKNGKTRKVHNLILLPGLEQADALAQKLEGTYNLHSDGRPILGLDSRDLLEITLDICPDALFIPAHIWTPHFSLFGAYSGFDAIEECFEDLTGNIHALETGLSSDPPMNWRLSALDRFTLVSNSDAHSPANLAREANLFDTGLSYPDIAHALSNPGSGEFRGTLEFYPEEGKYHCDGHRNCKVCMKPGETIAANGVCPVCGGRITVGVLHRAEALADRPEGYTPPNAARFEWLVPLREIIASTMGVGVASKRVQAKYNEVTSALGPELAILREIPLADIARGGGPLLAEGVRRLRDGEVDIRPGYDGEYGVVRVIDKSELEFLTGQLSFLDGDEEFYAQPEQTSAPATAAPGEMPPAQASTRIAEENNPYGLNSGQWAAASSPGSVAVIAGPGTGKTATLVSRVAHLVEHSGVNPKEITAVTFTNKAAAQMSERLNARFGDKRTAKAMTIGTFHSICLQYLKKGKRDMTVIDGQDALELMSEAVSGNGCKPAPREALRIASLVKSGALKLEDADIPPEVYSAYNGKLAQYGAMDFDDILLAALEIMEDGGNSFPAPAYLLVDEFQDINPVQYRLIRAWTARGASLFAIGDPSQSIYGFRGSDPRCFDSLFTDYPGIETVSLTKNYRSTPEIIGCAEAAIPREHALTAMRGGGVKTQVLRADSPLSEAIYVAKEIGRMVGGVDMLDAHRHSKNRPGARGLSDIAVLYRTNMQARALEQCLKKEGIPYTVAGRDTFLEDPHVRRALAFFRCVLNPGDLISKRICGDDAELLAKYVQLHNEKPAALVEMWIDGHSLAGEAPMEMLLGAATAYGRMADFLAALALGREADILRSGGKTYGRDSVSLMTIHAAKGLEFPAVFLCGLSEGTLPLKTRGVCDMDEELRLFYVGMTRAADELILIGRDPPSPFLALLPGREIEAGDALPQRKPKDVQISLFD